MALVVGNDIATTSTTAFRKKLTKKTTAMTAETTTITVDSDTRVTVTLTVSNHLRQLCVQCLTFPEP